jgi:hypothetical protein
MTPNSNTVRKVLSSIFSDNKVNELLIERDNSDGTKLKSIEAKITNQDGSLLTYLILFEYYEPNPDKNTFDDVAVKVKYDLSNDSITILSVDTY